MRNRTPISLFLRFDLYGICPSFLLVCTLPRRADRDPISSASMRSFSHPLLLLACHAKVSTETYSIVCRRQFRVATANTVLGCGSLPIEYRRRIAQRLHCSGRNIAVIFGSLFHKGSRFCVYRNGMRTFHSSVA